jgi:ubiquinone/menaquinone biosynthesis C-methylase UbiE
MTESTARTGWNDPESALAYDQRMIPAVGLPMAEALLRALPPPPGATVLEVASGTGFFSEHLLMALGPGGAVVGCDAGHAMLQLATAKHRPGLWCVESDAHHLPVPAARFPAAYSNLGLHIVLEPVRVLAEMAQALQPGGGLAYTIPGRGTLIEFWEVFAERAARPDLRDRISASGWATIQHWTTTDDAADLAPHRERLAAAGLQRVQLNVESHRLIFRNAEDLLSRGGFGHYNFALETIPDESIRRGVLAEVAALLDARHPGGEIPITVRPLVASGWK